MNETPQRPDRAVHHGVRGKVNDLFRPWDEWVDDQVPNSWGRYTPRKRKMVAALIALESTAVVLIIGFFMERSMKDPAAWVIMGLIWLGTVSFFAGMARNPVRTVKVALRVLLWFFVLGVVAYLVFIAVVLIAS